ncbi:MAG: protein-glutamate O-methyltransferase CheR [Deltaproteobacteria bacterium]|nr:protein-glutamate O-methyltransferase CheR [Deltaproteobacteria bacterium]
MMTIKDSEFEAIRALVYQKFGINLTDQKRSLVVGRLQKMLRAKGFHDFGQYLAYIQGDESGRALGELVNRLSTNHTFFFREREHFDFFLTRVLPHLAEKKKKKSIKDLRIWCAGCATGEEAYTLMMVMLEFFGSQYYSWDAGLLATDISGDALKTAQEGTYPQERVANLPGELLRRYFRRGPGDLWLVDQRLKQEIVFRRFNLMNQVFPFKKAFDVIFCRNVMIYFDQPTREALVRRFHQFTAPGGYLFIGHSESLRRDSCPYDYVMPAVYRKKGE